MKKIVSLILALTFVALISGCTTQHAKGGGMGAAIGGASGALIDKRNPWRGGVIGAVIGAIAGLTVSELATQASREAVEANKPVEYRTVDGRGRYEAYPVDYNAQTKCHKVQEKVWEDGRLIKDDIKEVCEGEKTESRY